MPTEDPNSLATMLATGTVFNSTEFRFVGRDVFDVGDNFRNLCKDLVALSGESTDRGVSLVNTLKNNMQINLTVTYAFDSWS